MIHQNKGRGAIRLAKTHLLQRKEEGIAGISGILLRLLPKLATDGTVKSAVTKIVDKAVLFKNLITEEQVLYDCFWVDCGSVFEEECVDVVEEDPSGKVLLCTFPGLCRTIKEGDKISEITVVKASAILESSFVSQP
jgi:hypothetical protein